MNRTRIQLTDSITEVMQKMSGGNPGALTVLLDLMKESPNIDPQSALGDLGPVLLLDTLGIYEERIWMLYKDVCGCDIIKTLAVLRGYQLGIVSESDINRFIDDRENTFLTDDVLSAVKKELNKFDIERQEDGNHRSTESSKEESLGKLRSPRNTGLLQVCEQIRRVAGKDRARPAEGENSGLHSGGESA